jgi:hypothetical protein
MGKNLMNKVTLSLVLLVIILSLVVTTPRESSAATATFGLDSGNGNWNQGSNILDAMRFQNKAGTGTLTKIEILFNDTTPHGKVRMGVFSDNNRKPGSRLLDAGEANVANGWVSIGNLNLSVTLNAYYWLAFDLQNQNGVRYQSGQSTGSHYWVGYNYGTLPGQFNLFRANYNSSPYVMRATVITNINPPDTMPPSTPDGLAAMVISASQINLSWNPSIDNVGVTGYSLFRNGVQIVTLTTASYSDTSLQPLTNYTYTVAAFDAIGNTSAQSSPVSATTVAPGFSIKVNDFPNYRVLQRDIGGTSKNVPISGSYSSTLWNQVQARVLRHSTNTVLVDWTTIDTTPGGGTFSGNLIVPQGGWYNIEVRALDSAENVLGTSRGTNKWGVGMLILCIGQSNMSGHGQPQFTIANSDLAVNYSNAGIWEHLADPYDNDSPSGVVDNDNATASGSMIPALANSLLQTFNFPIAFIPSAKDNTNLYSQWVYRNPSNHYDTSSLYGQSITKARSVGGVELIVMHQGEADTNAHRTESQYETNFATLIGNYRQDLYATIPIFICQLGTIELGTNTRTEADVLAIRDAQHDLDNGKDIFMAATAMDLPRLDAVHYTTPGLNVIGQRVAQAIKYYFGATSYYRGPAINSATFAVNRSTIDVQIIHRGGNDLTPPSGITGFSVLSNGSPVGIIAADCIGEDIIRLKLELAVQNGAVVKLRYLRNSNPDTRALVKDNSTMALPLENTTIDVTVN